MALTVTALGCSGTYAGAGGACSGYLVRDDDTTVWVDAGSGTLANLQRHAGLGDVDAIILSHEHPDHWTDLEGYYNVCRFVLERRGVPIYAPAGLKDRTYDDDTSPYLEWNDVSGGDHVHVGTLAVTFSRTDHGPETLAMRVDSGRLSVGYSADTGPGWSLEALGPGLDLALCEATLPPGFGGGLQHLTAEQAGTSAREARVDKLVITHLWPTVDAAQSQRDAAAAFGHDVVVATTNETYLA
jgi:ribonuclease BN (tRNA processing enzyme)